MPSTASGPEDEDRNGGSSPPPEVIIPNDIEQTWEGEDEGEEEAEPEVQEEAAVALEAVDATAVATTAAEELLQNNPPLPPGTHYYGHISNNSTLGIATSSSFDAVDDHPAVSSRLPATYTKSRLNTVEAVVGRRERKNAQSRARAAKLRARVNDIKRKSEEERTPEEKEIFDSYERKRNKKNSRSTERAKERKEECDRILAKDPERRTTIENAYLVNALGAKKRKNEGDRIRRLRMKGLVMNATGLEYSAASGAELVGANLQPPLTQPPPEASAAPHSHHPNYHPRSPQYHMHPPPYPPHGYYGHMHTSFAPPDYGASPPPPPHGGGAPYFPPSDGTHGYQYPPATVPVRARVEGTIDPNANSEHQVKVEEEDPGESKEPRDAEAVPDEAKKEGTPSKAIVSAGEDKVEAENGNAEDRDKARQRTEEFENKLIDEQKEEEDKITAMIIDKEIAALDASNSLVENQVQPPPTTYPSPRPPMMEQPRRDMSQAQLKYEEERWRQRRVQAIARKKTENRTEEEQVLYEQARARSRQRSDELRRQVAGDINVAARAAADGYPPASLHHPAMQPYPHHPGYYYGGHHPPMTTTGYYAGVQHQRPPTAQGYYPGAAELTMGHHHAMMYPPYGSRQASNAACAAKGNTGPCQTDETPPVPPPPAPATAAAANAVSEPSNVILKTYVEPRVVKKSRNEKKNAQSRARHAKLKARVEEIGRKLPEERTEEEAAVYDLFTSQRERKNARTKERSQEKKEEVERILAKPVKKRTKIEKEFLKQDLKQKQRKNNADRIRRQRMKEIAESFKGAAPGLSPRGSGRGPMLVDGAYQHYFDNYAMPPSPHVPGYGGYDNYNMGNPEEPSPTLKTDDNIVAGNELYPPSLPEQPAVGEAEDEAKESQAFPTEPVISPATEQDSCALDETGEERKAATPAAAVPDSSILGEHSENKWV